MNADNRITNKGISPGFVAHYETGQDSVKRFDAHITVYGDGKEVTVNYDT